MFLGIFDMQAIHGSDDTHHCHDITEHLAQLVNPSKGQLPIHEVDHSVGAVLHVKDTDKGRNRYNHQVGLKRLSPEKREQQCSENQYKSWMYELSHRNNPPETLPGNPYQTSGRVR